VIAYHTFFYNYGSIKIILQPTYKFDKKKNAAYTTMSKVYYPIKFNFVITNTINYCTHKKIFVMKLTNADTIKIVL